MKKENSSQSATSLPGDSGSLTRSDGYQNLVEQISHTYAQGRAQVAQVVNTQLLDTIGRWGQHIVEFEQQGNVRAAYGKALLKQLASDLGLRHGKGFSRSNLIRIRQFYLAYPKGATVSHLLSWSHYVELLKIDDLLERTLRAARESGEFGVGDEE